MRKWGEHCAIQDLHKTRSGRPKDARTVENVEKIREILDNTNGRKSISKIYSNTGISKTTTRRIMKDDLKKFPNKLKVSQKSFRCAPGEASCFLPETRDHGIRREFRAEEDYF